MAKKLHAESSEEHQRLTAFVPIARWRIRLARVRLHGWRGQRGEKSPSRKEEDPPSIPLVSGNPVESRRVFFDLLLKRFEFGLVGIESNLLLNLSPSSLAIIFCEQRFCE